jgi:glycosyltransferase involved in cell wall biosynthesis
MQGKTPSHVADTMSIGSSMGAGLPEPGQRIEARESVDVAVVIPCYNAADFIEETLRSVFNQRPRPIEVIVVDDGSTDGTWELLQHLRSTDFPSLKVICHPGHANLRQSSCRFRGLHLTTARYVAFLDADDVFLPGKLQAQVIAMEHHPRAVLCHTGVRVLGDQSKAAFFEGVFAKNPEGLYDYRQIDDYLIRNSICNSSCLVRADAIKSIRFAFFQQPYAFEDWLCWCLLSAKGPFLNIRQPLTGYRVHENMVTATLANDRLRVLYSQLELKLVFFVRCESPWHALRILASLMETARLLMVHLLIDPVSMDTDAPPVPRNGTFTLLMGLAKLVRLPGEVRQAIHRRRPPR